MYAIATVRADRKKTPFKSRPAVSFDTHQQGSGEIHGTSNNDSVVEIKICRNPQPLRQQLGVEQFSQGSPTMPTLHSNPIRIMRMMGTSTVQGVIFLDSRNRFQLGVLAERADISRFLLL